MAGVAERTGPARKRQLAQRYLYKSILHHADVSRGFPLVGRVPDGLATARQVPRMRSRVLPTSVAGEFDIGLGKPCAEGQTAVVARRGSTGGGRWCYGAALGRWQPHGLAREHRRRRT